MRRVLHFIRPYLIFVITGLLCAVVSVVTQLLVPIFCGDAIDAMIGAGRVDFASVVRIVLAIAVATGITAAAQWVLSVCNNRIIFGVSVICEMRQLERSRHCRFPIWTCILRETWSAASLPMLILSRMDC